MKFLQKEKGAIMLEASVGLLALFLLVFTIIEFARYATLTAVLQASADEALALAQTVSNIDSADTNKRNAANAKVQEIATRIASKTFFGSTANAPVVTVSIPQPINASPTEEQRRKALEKEPIRIELSATIPSITGQMFGANFVVKAKAVGYREPRNPFSEPEPLDCKGNPIAIGSPQPTDCACPGAESNPDVTYNPAISKCTCNVPSHNLTYTAGFPLSFLEQGLEFDPASGTCKCPGDWISTNPAAGEPAGKCKCKYTDALCEDYNKDWRGRLGSGAHVKTRFNGYNICECQSPCQAGNPNDWNNIAPTTWDPVNQRCECTRPSNWQQICQNIYKANNGGQAYTGTFGMGNNCDCKTCGLGVGEPESAVQVNDYAWGCDCSSAPPCVDPTAGRAPYYSCGCTCPGENPHVRLPNGTIKCAPNGCRPGQNSCFYDSQTGEIKVCESGGLCANPLPFVSGG